jgi:hypothetical protein
MNASQRKDETLIKTTGCMKAAAIISSLAVGGSRNRSKFGNNRILFTVFSSSKLVA